MTQRFRVRWAPPVGEDPSQDDRTAGPMALTDPRAFIDARSPDVADIPAEMISIVLDGGGDLRPGLTPVERADAMTVPFSDGLRARRGQPLLTVRRELLVPVEAPSGNLRRRMWWCEPPRLSPWQRDLLGLHVALYTAIGKIPATVAGHPRVSLARPPISPER